MTAIERERDALRAEVARLRAHLMRVTHRLHEVAAHDSPWWQDCSAPSCRDAVRVLGAAPKETPCE